MKVAKPALSMADLHQPRENGFFVLPKSRKSKNPFSLCWRDGPWPGAGSNFLTTIERVTLKAEASMKVARPALSMADLHQPLKPPPVLVASL